MVYIWSLADVAVALLTDDDRKVRCLNQNIYVSISGAYKNNQNAHTVDILYTFGVNG